MRRHKRPFLLLEILICFALITLCLFPLVKPHLTITREEFEELFTTQLSFHADAAYLKVLERLYAQNVHSWDDLNKGCQGTLNESFATIYKKRKQEYICTYHLSKARRKSPDRVSYLLLDLSLSFQSDPPLKESPIFNYALIVEGHET